MPRRVEPGDRGVRHELEVPAGGVWDGRLGGWAGGGRGSQHLPAPLQACSSARAPPPACLSQVDSGEWDVMEALGDARYRGQGSDGKGRVDRGQLADERLDAPLPWDHIGAGCGWCAPPSPPPPASAHLTLLLSLPLPLGEGELCQPPSEHQPAAARPWPCAPRRYWHRQVVAQGRPAKGTRGRHSARLLTLGCGAATTTAPGQGAAMWGGRGARHSPPPCARRSKPPQPRTLPLPRAGICSECGVCGDEFGDNVVAEVPPIPEFQGHYTPNSAKTQRLRFRCEGRAASAMRRTLCADHAPHAPLLPTSHALLCCSPAPPPRFTGLARAGTWCLWVTST